MISISFGCFPFQICLKFELITASLARVWAWLVASVQKDAPSPVHCSVQVEQCTLDSRKYTAQCALPQ